MGRQRRWRLVPRETKKAIERLCTNLGHPPTAALVRALKMGNATEAAINAARLYKSEASRRVQRPALPRPSQLPRVDEFNVMLAMDCFENKDADGVGVLGDLVRGDELPRGLLAGGYRQESPRGRGA